MNSQSCCQKTRAGAVVVATLGAFLVVALLVRLMKSNTESATALEVRAAERLKILDDFKAANEPLLDKYDWQDQAKGFVRVPIQRAKQLMLEQWRQDPLAARSNLMARAAKEFFIPPPAPPPKNIYE
jgi:hypothetical protein